MALLLKMGKNYIADWRCKRERTSHVTLERTEVIQAADGCWDECERLDL